MHENRLLNGQGNVMISDFGISEKLESRAAQMKGRTGTKVYMPPEPAQGLAFGFEFDWWTFGVTLFELLSNELPTSLHLSFPDNEHFTPEAIDLIQRLLEPVMAQRLGYRGAESIAEHHFFSDVSWDGVSSKAPI